PATVVARGRRQVQSRYSERRPELDDAASIAAAREDVEQSPLLARDGNIRRAHAPAEARWIGLAQAEEVGRDERRGEREPKEVAARSLVEAIERAFDARIVQR